MQLNWSIPPNISEPGKKWTTQCWGPSSKTAQCEQRSMDNLTCWGTFVSSDCNNTDIAGARYNPNNLKGPAAPPFFDNNSKNFNNNAIGEFANNRQGLLSNRCWKELFSTMGDGTVIGAGFGSEPRNFF
jgi:hypothetical protein